MAEYTLGLDPRSESLATARPDILKAASDRWPVSQATPKQIGELLRVSRELFVHAAFVYDFFTVAAAWALFALEASLRDLLSPDAKRVSLGRLIASATDEGLISGADADRLNAGAGFRNYLTHPWGQVAITPGLAEEILETTHQFVARFYERSVTSRIPNGRPR